MFSNETGISLNGDVMLRCDDVASNWLKVIQGIH